MSNNVNTSLTFRQRLSQTVIFAALGLTFLAGGIFEKKSNEKSYVDTRIADLSAQITLAKSDSLRTVTHDRAAAVMQQHTLPAEAYNTALLESLVAEQSYNKSKLTANKTAAAFNEARDNNYRAYTLDSGGVALIALSLLSLASIPKLLKQNI